MDLAGRLALAETQKAKRGKPGPSDWLEDPYAYDQAVRAAIGVLDVLRPEGVAHSPRHDQPVFKTADGKVIDNPELVTRLNELRTHPLTEPSAVGMLITDLVGKTLPVEAPPGFKETEDERLAGLIATGLGPLKERLVKKRQKFHSDLAEPAKRNGPKRRKGK